VTSHVVVPAQEDFRPADRWHSRVRRLAVSRRHPADGELEDLQVRSTRCCRDRVTTKETVSVRSSSEGRGDARDGWAAPGAVRDDVRARRKAESACARPRDRVHS